VHKEPLPNGSLLLILTVPERRALGTLLSHVGTGLSPALQELQGWMDQEYVGTPARYSNPTQKELRWRRQQMLGEMELEDG